MRIEVTAEDIKNGVPMEASDCPVALALHRATGRMWRVDSRRICPNEKFGDMLSFPCPPAAAVFVCRFDDCLPVEPFSFEFEPTT